MIEPVAVITALIGAYLVGSWDPYWRCYGFVLWIFSNSFWVIHGIEISDFWIILQFGVFLIMAFRGTKNNLAAVPWIKNLFIKIFIKRGNA